MQTDTPKILIIDDDSRNIFALSAVLKARGYTCVSAPGAREGIERLEAESGIGLVLMDMMMPDMDGYEAIGQIRATEGIRDIPVVAVTAQAMVGDRERALTAGANAYVSKPVNVDHLLVYLKQYLG